jgi:Iron-containing redox enzyme
MLIPKARGSLSAALFAVLPSLEPDDVLPPFVTTADDEADEQIALWALYELHYRGFEDADAALEWHPDLLRLRRALELALEHRLQDRYTDATVPSPGQSLADTLFALVEGHRGPSLAAYVQRDAAHEQVLELLRMRSIYHLKETDPTSWAVPRLPRASQAALVELMYDEYGCGRQADVHSELFARALVALGLDDRYGAYVDEAPTEVLEQNNAMTLFGLHRRLRGAAVGHLAGFEATSSLPSRRMAQGLERLGMPADVTRYYLEHVEADAVHEQLAVRGICAALVEEDPASADSILFGAFTCLDLEARMASAVLTSWGVAS